MQVTLLPLTACRESHAIRYDLFVSKRKYLRFLRWVETQLVSPEVESEKWRRLLLHWMYDAFDVSTDGREEDFLLEMECSGSIVVSIPDVVKD
ncbi:hypothetical protein Tco_0301026 [Tanacetum coccineum]